MTRGSLRQMFRYFNRFMVAMWRLGMGPLINIWPQVIGRIMVISHTGRKSGLLHQTPVNYALIDGEIFCVSGYGTQSDWYQNIAVSPEVEVWLPQGWWTGQAFIDDDRPDRLDIMRQVLIGSGFAAPLFAGIYPRKINNLELEQLTKDYRLIRIHRTQACTGPGGPSDLAWIWPALACMMVIFWLAGTIYKRCTRNRSK